MKCDHFTVRKVTAKRGQEPLIPSGEPIILMFISGHGEIIASGSPTKFARGETILLPAATDHNMAKAEADSLWLQISLVSRR